jgi:Zn-dependent oligopeptidase
VPIKVDETIMAELLEQPGIKEQVDQMTPEMLEWFKELLVSQGVYARFVSERQNQQVKQMVKNTFRRGKK